MTFPPPLRIGVPLVLIVFGLALGLFTFVSEVQDESEDIESGAETRIRFLGTSLSGMTAMLFEMNSFTAIDREVAMKATAPDVVRVLIAGDDGLIWHASQRQYKRTLLKSPPFEQLVPIIEKARSQPGGVVEFSAGRTRLQGAFPIPLIRQGTIGVAGYAVAFIEMDLTVPKDTARIEDRNRLVVGLLLIGGLTLVFTFVFHRMLTRRVERIVATSRDLAAGHLHARTNLRGGDELAELAEAFDKMAADLEQRDADLRASEERFRELAENVEEVFWIHDLDAAHITYANPAFERVFGRSPAEITASSRLGNDFIHPADQPRVNRAFQDIRHGPCELEYRILRPEGTTRWLRCRYFPIREPGGIVKKIAGVAEDITVKKVAADEKDAFERKLQETQRLESLGVLAGGIAHDFNNLLTAVLGNASLARMSLDQGHEANQSLAEIEATAIRAADLCKQMLAYSGKGRFVVQLIDLSALVKETTQLLQISIAKNAVLRFDLDASLPPVSADPTQLRQVVMNLVINASEALGGKSGTISLRTGVVRVDAEYIASTLLGPDVPGGDYVFLEVADNGCGMAPETQARIFEPFFTTKFTGRGLGLSAVLGIVRGHKGAMKVYSEAGRGTTFKLLFPVAEGHAQPADDSPTTSGTWRGKGTVLVVDDEETVRAVSARMLESFGFTVALARDGHEGVEKFKELPEVTAVLMDLTMPRMDGEAAFRQLRTLNPHVRVVLMSGFNEQDAINRFTGKGLAGFIQKPFKLDALRTKIREVLDKEITL